MSVSERKRWMDRGVQLCLLLAALIHLPPLAGLAGGPRLQEFYGLAAVPEPGVELLLRHRAILFGLLGSALLLACWRIAWRIPAIVMVLVSDLVFLLLAWSAPTLSPALARVAWFDLASIALLMVAGLWSCRHDP